MKIERDGNMFTITVRHAAHAETLDALLRIIALTIAGPNLPDPYDRPGGSARGGTGHPIGGLTLTLNVNPWQADPLARPAHSGASPCA